MTASAVSTIYQLANHPDGGAAAPFYGLRLDGLYGGDAADIFTFDFEHPDADMRLVYDDGDTAAFGDDSIRIFGTAFGGLDIGSAYDPNLSGLFQVEFLYSQNIVSGGNELEVGDDSPLNMGTITPLFNVPGFSDGPIPLVDYTGSHSFSFRFNNTENHRLDGTGLSGPEIFVGYGWMNHSGKQHKSASDWLFTGTLIPEPGTGSLLALGLVGLAAQRRTRR